MSSYLITGAGRGLGLELAKQLLELPNAQVSKVFTLSRSQPSAGLQQLLDQHKDRATHVVGAVDDSKSINSVVHEVETSLAGKGLDVLINPAGISPSNPHGKGTHAVPAAQMMDAYSVNVIGVHTVTSSLLPLLQKGKDKKVISISSTLGAISWANKFQQSPTSAYKISKSALNMMMTLYAQDHAKDGFTFLLISPGWLKTDLGSDKADLEVPVGAKEVVRMIQEANPSMNGKFLNIHVPGWEKAWGQYDGGEISW